MNFPRNLPSLLNWHANIKTTPLKNQRHLHAQNFSDPVVAKHKFFPIYP